MQGATWRLKLCCSVHIGDGIHPDRIHPSSSSSSSQPPNPSSSFTHLIDFGLPCHGIVVVGAVDVGAAPVEALFCRADDDLQIALAVLLLFFLLCLWEFETAASVGSMLIWE